MSEPTTIADCCTELDPCKAMCMLQNVMVQMAAGKAMTSYSIGGERFSFKQPSLSEVRSLYDNFKQLCAAVNPNAVVRRRRAKVCFVYADNECTRCRQTTCRC